MEDWTLVEGTEPGSRSFRPRKLIGKLPNDPLSLSGEMGVEEARFYLPFLLSLFGPRVNTFVRVGALLIRGVFLVGVRGRGLKNPFF